MDPQDQYRMAERPSASDGRGRKLALTLGISAAVVAAIAALVAVAPAVRSLLPEAEAGGRAYPTQSVPDGVSVTTSESAAAGDVLDPFAGTAAAGYPKGAAGITLPPAKAVKGFTAKEVETSLKKVKAAMVAGRLDTAMLVGHKPAKFLAMLAPSNREDIGRWFKNNDFSSVATWIAPTAKLDTEHEPRVNGRITYASRKVEDIQTLQVTTNFVWVYAFQGPDRPIAVQHDEITWEFTDPDDVYPKDRGMWLAEAESYMAMVDCDAANKGMLAPDLSPGVVPADTTNPDDLLKPDHKLDIRDDC